MLIYGYISPSPAIAISISLVLLGDWTRDPVILIADYCSSGKGGLILVFCMISSSFYFLSSSIITSIALSVSGDYFYSSSSTEGDVCYISISKTFRGKRLLPWLKCSIDWITWGFFRMNLGCYCYWSLSILRFANVAARSVDVVLLILFIS